MTSRSTVRRWPRSPIGAGGGRSPVGHGPHTRTHPRTPRAPPRRSCTSGPRRSRPAGGAEPRIGLASAFTCPRRPRPTRRRTADIRAAETALGTRHVRLATEEEIEKDFPRATSSARCRPSDRSTARRLNVDPEVMQHDTVVFAAGTQTESVRVRTEDLFRKEPVTTAPLTRLFTDDEGLPNRTTR